MSKGRSVIKAINRRVDPDGTLRLFDERPMECQGFRFTSVDVEVVGDPKIEEWATAFELVGAMANGSPWWIGALADYAESRKEWAEKLPQVMAATGLARQTILNLTNISRSVEPPERRLAPSITHAAEVASLPREEQAEWLAKATTEGWKASELRKEIRTARRRKIIDGQAVLEGVFRVALFDCPWTYGDSMPSGSSATSAYPTMSIEDIIALGPMVQAHLERDAVAFFWVPEPLLYQTPGPREVIAAFGLQHKTGMVWKKERGYGHYVRVMHEHLLICTRGGRPFLPDRPTPQLDSFFTTSDKNMAHSQKPSEAYGIIERLYNGPYAEFFASTPRAGWASYGNDARLWETT